MDLGGFAEKSVTALGTRFGLVGLLPSALFVVFCVILLRAGAPASAPEMSLVLKDFTQFSSVDSLLLIVVILTISIILQPFQTAFIQLLEGYWGSSHFSRTLSGFFASRHCRKRDRVRAEIEQFEKSGIGPSANKSELATEAGTLADRLARSYPANKCLPTMLGNILRAGEENAGISYGLDVVTIWPRLYAVLPKATAALVDDLRNQLDIAVRFCVMSGLATAVSFCLLCRHGWWLLLPAATAVLAWISYRAAIICAFSYGVGMRLAVDLHRFDLLTALHLPLPRDRETEFKFNLILSEFFRQGRRENFKYEHSKDKPAADVPSPGDSTS
jgi:hypothetical protein